MSQSRLTSTKDSMPWRFNINRHLEGLKSEFEVMAQEIESLRKERDGYKAKVEAQVKELHAFQRNVVCGGCRKGAMSTPQIIGSSQLKARKTAISASSRLVPQSNSVEKPSGSIISRRVNQRMTPPSTQRTTLIQESHSAESPSMTQASDPFVAHSQSVSFKDHNLSIVFNNDAEKELDVEMMYALSHGDTIESVAFSRDGKYLATGCADGKAYIYDAERGTLTRILRNLLAEEDSIRAVCFSHDGKYLATASSDWNVYIWEIKTRYVRNTFQGHSDRANSLNFSPSGRLLVSASNDNTVRLWNMRYGAAKVLTDDNPDSFFLSAVFSPDGMYVAASNSDGMVRIWDARVGQLMRRIKSDIDWVSDVAFIPDGKGLMSGRLLKYWDVSSLSTRAGLGVEEQTQHEREFLTHTGCVYSLSISPDGRWVASGSYDCNVRIWDTRSAAIQCSLKHDDTVFTVDFSPTCSLLASGDCSGAVKIWRYSYTTVGGNEAGGGT